MNPYRCETCNHFKTRRKLPIKKYPGDGLDVGECSHPILKKNNYGIEWLRFILVRDLGCASHSNFDKVTVSAVCGFESGLVEGKQQERTKILKLLKELEWSGNHTDYEDSWAVMTVACPSCRNAKKDGHKKSCKLNAILTGEIS